MLNFGGKSIGEMYYGGRKIGEAYLGDRLVYQSVNLPVEVMPNGSSAREWLQGKLVEYGEHYTTVENLPFKLDMSQVENMDYLFYGCTSLTTVPDMDTSNVTSMRSVFKGCSSLTSVPDMDTSNVTRMIYTFHGCTSLTTVPDMDTSNVTSMSYMFQGCSSLTSVPDMDTSKVTDTTYMFRECESLTDGNVRLLMATSSKPSRRTDMIQGSGLTREPFYLYDGTPI